MSDMVFIRELECSLIIGCFPHEKTKPQKIIIDVEMYKSLEAAAEKDDVTLTVDYADAVKKIQQFAQELKVELLETLAEKLAAFLIQEYSLEKIKIQIQKPEAIPGVPGVGIKISRKNDAD